MTTGDDDVEVFFCLEWSSLRIYLSLEAMAKNSLITYLSDCKVTFLRNAAGDSFIFNVLKKKLFEVVAPRRCGE